MKVQVLTALAALTLSTAASAQLYGVVSAGVSKLSFDCGAAASCDKTDTGFKIMGGYKFMPNLAAEIGYFDFGKAKATNLDIKGTGFGAGVAYHQDLAPNWGVVARGGIAQVKTELSGSTNDSDSNVEPYLGLGIGYRLNKNLSIDGSWDYSRGKYNKGGIDESGSANMFSAGVTFGF
jgi:OOP family OmpA-OmpF porin